MIKVLVTMPITIFFAMPVFAQEEDLAKKLANPIASH
jgi:hypothetical protein